MAIQTAYNENIRAAVAGHRADDTPATIISRTVELAAGIDHGGAVARGSEAHFAKAFLTGANHWMGVCVRERNANPSTPDKVARYESAGIMTQGTIWVKANVQVAAGDPVYVIKATGLFSNVVGTGATAAVLIPDAVWDTSTSGAGQLAIVRLGQTRTDGA